MSSPAPLAVAREAVELHPPVPVERVVPLLRYSRVGMAAQALHRRRPLVAMMLAAPPGAVRAAAESTPGILLEPAERVAAAGERSALARIVAQQAALPRERMAQMVVLLRTVWRP